MQRSRSSYTVDLGRVANKIRDHGKACHCLQGKSAVLKVSSSISSLVSKYSSRSNIQHDNTSISLTGKPRSASQATPAEQPGVTLQASTPRTSQDPGRRNSTPWALEPIDLEPASARPPSPRGSTLQGSTPRSASPRASNIQAVDPETPVLATPKLPQPVRSPHSPRKPYHIMFV